MNNMKIDCEQQLKSAETAKAFEMSGNSSFAYGGPLQVLFV
jgi:hypothetical protein